MFKCELCQRPLDTIGHIFGLADAPSSGRLCRGCQELGQGNKFMDGVTLRNLCVGTYAQGVTQWFYVTSDTRRELEGTLYWHDAKDTVKPGDWLFVTHNGTNSGNSIFTFYKDRETGHTRARLMLSSLGS